MVFFKTEFNGYSVKFSPWDSKIAVATAQNFGIVGNGKQDVLELLPDGRLHSVGEFYTQDGQFDCAWSEEVAYHLVSSCGDGSVKLWDIRQKTGRPLRSWKEHSAEIYGIDWNLQKKDNFITASWDKSVKIWNPSHPTAIRTFAEHHGVLYAAMWDPLTPDRFATASGDKTVKIWDARGPKSVLTIPAHSNEVLSLDWNKYKQNTIVTGSVDRSVRVFDLRRPETSLTDIHGHSYAVRRVRFSPFSSSMVISVSYDRSFCVWDWEKMHSDPLIEKLELHSEFAVGCDFSLFVNGLVASCGWDCNVVVWQLGKDPKR